MYFATYVSFFFLLLFSLFHFQNFIQIIDSSYPSQLINSLQKLQEHANRLSYQPKPTYIHTRLSNPKCNTLFLFSFSFSSLFRLMPQLYLTNKFWLPSTTLEANLKPLKRHANHPVHQLKYTYIHTKLSNPKCNTLSFPPFPFLLSPPSHATISFN